MPARPLADPFPVTTPPPTVAVVSQVPLDSPRAHAINIIKTAGGFARAGHDVTLFCSPPETGDTAAALAAHAEPSLTIRTSPLADPRAFADWAISEARRAGTGFLYARHFHAAIAAAEARIPATLETHAYPDSHNAALDEALLRTNHTSAPLRAVSTISPLLRNHLIARGADPARVHITPDGVDTDLFSPPTSLPASPFTTPRPNILYAGHLYDHKGIPTILACAKLLEHVNFHLLGGLDEDIARTRDSASRAALANIHIHGRVPHADVPRFLWHADALLLPISTTEPSHAWTSPVKLGEYLAAQRPIIASDITGLRNWADRPAVTWSRPDNPASLAAAIDAALREAPADAATRRARQLALAQAYSYTNRAMRLLDIATRPPSRRSRPRTAA